MAKRKPPLRKNPTIICTHTMTREADEFLQQLGQEATDALGWTVSKSAILRALVRYAAEQPSSWPSTTLHPLIEQEIAQGVIWGSKKK